MHSLVDEKRSRTRLVLLTLIGRSLALDPSKADQLTMEDYLQLTNSLTEEER